mgnify:CR=1 FL=1
MPVNEYGQMIGEPIDDTPGVLPSLVRIEGQYAIIEALSVEKHAVDLLVVYGPESPREMWTYLFQPPVENLEELIAALKQMLALPSQVVSPTNKSQILKKGQVRSKRAPSDALMSAQVAVGKTFSPPGTQN